MDETTAVVDGQGAGGVTAADVLYDHVMPDNRVQSIGASLVDGDGAGVDVNDDKVAAAQAMEPTAYQLDVPAGFEVSEEDLQTFKAAARDMVLSNEQANELLKMHLERVSESVEKSIQRVGDEWLLNAKHDPEIGGSKLAESLRAANHVLERFGGGKLREALTQTRFGDHPEMIRFLAKIGAAMGEGAYNRGVDAPKAEERSAADVLFDFGK